MEYSTAEQGRPHERWGVATDSRLKFRFWGDECVLFHGAAGDTHRLPAVVGHLVQALAQAEASIGELSERIDLHEDDVRDALQDMLRLGIAERRA